MIKDGYVEQVVKVSMMLDEDETEEEAEERLYQALCEGLCFNMEFEGKEAVDFEYV